jgi:hypothetical protein
MAQREERKPEERRLEELLEAAHRDRQLKLRLLAKPREVAKEWGVELADPEVARLEKLGAFVDMAEEAKRGRLFLRCDPRVCYPSTVWLRQAALELAEAMVRIIRWPDPIFYPADPLLRFRQSHLLRRHTR